MPNYFYILIIYNFIIINSQNCIDPSCLECSKNGDYCYKCKSGFINHYSKCGKKCNSILNCQLCNEEESKCIKCKSNCLYTGIYCDCTERYILSIVLIFFSIIVIAIIIFCLMHTSSRRSRYILNLFNGRLDLNGINITRHPLSEETNYRINNRLNELQMINDFNKNKINVDKDIENIKCVICKSNICNLKMGCGCFICFECEKKCIKVNMCINCKKNITTMQQVSCSICFCNKNEISTFNCPCKIVICKECYLKWRKQNNFCPSCRGPII